MNCKAIVHYDWHTARCDNKPKDLGLCGIHLRVYRKWCDQGRGEPMAEYWWKTSIQQNDSQTETP